MKVALVHECVAGFHGSERVLAELAYLYPDAPIFVTACEPGVLDGTPLAGRELRRTWLDRLLRVPGLRGRHRLMLPLMPHAVQRHDLRGFDVVISSHHAAAHGVLTRSDQLHLCYTHSPARYAWDLVHEHVDPRRAAPLKRTVLHRFRQWDQLAGQRVDGFAANAHTVARRIRKVYGRPARVIHPPVDTARFDPTRPREDFYVVLGRLVPYKRAGLVVEAFNRLNTEHGGGGEGRARRRLVVIGDGPLGSALRRAAGPGVELAGALDDAGVADRLERCRALVFAGEEDFGMAPVEAMAAGAPVIALDRGGARETVVDGETGVRFAAAEPVPTADEVAAGVRRFEAQGVVADAAGLNLHAAAFGREPFRRAVEVWIREAWGRFGGAPAEDDS